MTISRCVRFRGGPVPPTSPAQNPNPGIEIVRHLEAELPRLGVAVLGTEDVEYAHLVGCQVNGEGYEVVVGYDWVEGDCWEVYYEPRRSWLRRILGHSAESGMRALTSAIAIALGELMDVVETRWYEAYAADRGRYSASPEY